MAAMLMFVACDKPQSSVDNPEPKDPATLSIDDNYAQVKVAGGDY